MAVLRYQDSVADIKGFAFKLQRRLYAAGVKSVDHDDIVQELSVVWMKAAEAWNENGDASFRTYLNRCMVYWANRWIQKEVGKRHAIAFSLDDVVTKDGSASTIGQIVPDQSDSAEETFEQRDHFKRVIGSLSPRAQLYVRLLENPPVELVAELRALNERTRFARSRGLSSVAPATINGTMIFDLMGASRRERWQIGSEIKQALEKVSQL